VSGGAADDQVRGSASRPETVRKVHHSHLGPNRLALRLIAVQAALLALTACLYPMLGLSLAWDTTRPFIRLFGVLTVIWAYYFFNPGRRNEWKVADTLFVFILLLVLGQVVAAAQYAAGALDRPVIDPLLAAIDRRLGFDVAALAAWTSAHPALNRVLEHAYESLLPQFTLTVPVLGLLLRDRSALWEYAFHFHFCAIATLLCFAAFPAECAFIHYGFASSFDQSRFIAHFQGVRSGALSRIRFDDMEGLVSMPSFHVAGAMMVTWVYRRHRLFLIPLAIVNATLIAATFMSGTHYVIDVIASLGLFVLSVAIYRKWAERLSVPGPVIPT
jgi:hypothetical protein